MARFRMMTKEVRNQILNDEYVPWRSCPKEYAHEAAKIAYALARKLETDADVSVLEDGGCSFEENDFWPRIMLRSYSNYYPEPLILQLRNSKDPGHRTVIAYDMEEAKQIAQRLCWQGLVGEKNPYKENAHLEAIDKWDADDYGIDGHD